MICPRKIVAAAMALWLLTPAAALPQGDPRARIRTTVELVVVPVTVKDPAGNLVPDLRQDEFRIFEDGVEQKITLFSADPFPLSVVLLLDNGLKLKTARQVGSSLRAIAAGFSDLDEVSICRFDTQLEQLADFTTDNGKILDQLKRLELDQRFPGQGSGPMTAGPRINAAPAPGAPSRAQMPLASPGDKNIDDAIFAAGQLLRGRERGRRKIVYLISDGLNSRHNAVSFDDAIKLLLSADISVYAIGVGEAVLNRGTSVLSKYAHATGGDVFYAARRADLESLYSLVTEEARNQYTLAYVPQNKKSGVEYHSVEVRVERPGLTLLARDGYFAAPTP